MATPNLLFIYTDQQTAATMAAYGNDQIETPNLDRLADRSIVFERAYCTQPVCTPSRSTLLTGLYPHSAGCLSNNDPLDQGVQCFPELSDFSGYRTAHMGKWHLGDEIFPQHGFDEWVSIEDGYRAYYSPGRDRSQHCDYWHWLTEQGVEPPPSEDGFNAFSRRFARELREEQTKAAFLAERASRFIEDCGSDPFLLYVSFLAPHPPFTGPRNDQYDPDEVPLPANFDAVPGPRSPLRHRLLYEHFRRRGCGGLPLRTEDNWRVLIARYWGLVSHVDAQIGRILDAVEQFERADETIIVFTSDHGEMAGAHRLCAKTVMFEEATRVPMMVHVPWLDEPAGRVRAPVSQIDLVPTLLDLLGRAVPAHLQGETLRPRLHDLHNFAGRDVFIEWNGSDNAALSINQHHMPEYLANFTTYDEAMRTLSAPIRTIITSTGWKLNCSAIGEHEVYNLQEDPGETTNLIDDPAAKALLANLYDRIEDWQEKTNDDDVHLGAAPAMR